MVGEDEKLVMEVAKLFVELAVTSVIVAGSQTAAYNLFLDLRGPVNACWA